MLVEIGKKYIDRSGFLVKIIEDKLNNPSGYSAIGIVILKNGGEKVRVYTKDGKIYNDEDSDFDLMSEISEWEEVPINTRVLVIDDKDGIWKRRYFAGFNNGPCYFKSGLTSYTNKGIPCSIKEKDIEILPDYNVGDEVFSLTHGKGIVSDIDYLSDYPIEVDFENKRMETFTCSGRMLHSDVSPTLLFKELKIPREYLCKNF